MLILVRLGLAVAAAMSLGYAWTVGQTGLKQTNRNLCELWASLPLPRYERCEFHYVLVVLWLFVAVVIVLWICIEVFLRRRTIKTFTLRVYSAVKLCVVYVGGKVARAAKQVEPWHVIVLGLVIAVAGIVWQQSRASPAPRVEFHPDPAIVTELENTKKQVREKERQLQEARKVQLAPQGGTAALEPAQREAVPRPPQPELKPTPPLPTRHYSPEERNDILGTLRSLQTFLETTRASVPSGLQRVSTMGRHGFMNLPRNSEALGVATELENYARNLESDRVAIKDILKKASFFEQVIYPIVDAPRIDEIYAKQRGAVLTVVEVLKEAAKLPDDIRFIPVALKQLEQVAEARSAHFTWAGDSIERIKAATKEIREWQ